MIGYSDTSAFVPLLVAEPGSDFCRQLEDACDAVVTSQLLPTMSLLYSRWIRGRGLDVEFGHGVAGGSGSPGAT